MIPRISEENYANVTENPRPAAMHINAVFPAKSFKADPLLIGTKVGVDVKFEVGAEIDVVHAAI